MNKNKKIIILIAIIVLIVIAIAAFYSSMQAPVDKSSKETINVTIEAGSGTSSIAAALKEKDLIKNTAVFKISSKMSGCDGKYKAGRYSFNKSLSMKEIMNDIVAGKTSTVNFTVTEGQTIEKIAQKLDSEGIVNYKKFIESAQKDKFDYSFINNSDKSIFRLEGYLYPDTYTVEIGTSEHKIIDTMLKGYESVVTDAYKQKAKAMGYSMHEILTVASIIERESGISSDMPLVSSVIYNRLKINMPLQMDSIVSYILKEDKVNLSLNDIAVESNYNPYKNTGLPPGPICSPGKAAIEAALNPAKTDYIYFVASEKLDGSQNFSVDYQQFLKDKDAYYKAYNKQEAEKSENK